MTTAARSLPGAPATVAASGGRVVVERVLPASPALVWPHVADSDMFNRQFLGPIRTTPLHDAGRPASRVKTRMGLIELAWVEHPFSFVVNERMEVRRLYDRGPMASLELLFELIPTGADTRVIISISCTARAAWMAPLVNLGARGIAKNYAQMLDHLAAFLAGTSPRPHLLPPPRLLDAARLTEGIRRLEGRGVSPSICGALDRWLREAHDGEVRQMRPLMLADRWATPRRATLAAFLEATDLGITELSWQVLCPNCRVPKATWRHLGQLEDRAHCDTCTITFGVDFDRLVEARFDVHPAIRKAEDALFCLSSPPKTPHLLAQADLLAGAETRFTLPAAVSAGRVADRSGAGIRLFREEQGPVHIEVNLNGEAGSTVVGPGDVEIVVHNRRDLRITACLQAEDWPNDVASAAMLSTMGEFRRLFSGEVLAPGLQVGVRTLTFLFTDLRGSTRYYQEVGDAAAFATVRDHFRLLEEVIEAHEGAVVKTIGDAVMAAFDRPDHALAAALAMQSRVCAWGVGRVEEPGRFLKVGLHEGPVIAVTLNGQLDYFGSTVNLAARIQGQSTGGDVVLSAGLWTEAHRALAEGWSAERFEAQLAGFNAPVELWRLRQG